MWCILFSSFFLFDCLIFRFIVLFGKDCVKPEGSTESPRVELHEVGTGEVQKLTLPETVQYLATKKN